MDLVWFGRFRRDGGQQGLYEWETGKGITGWDGASDPGKVGQWILRKIVRHDINDDWARSMSNIMHWSTGMAWGAAFGCLAVTVPRFRPEYGLLLGPTAWLSSYAILPLVKVYKPIWQYDTRTLERDLKAHMAFGLVTAGTFAVIAHSREL